MKKVFLSAPFGTEEELAPLVDALKRDGIDVWSADTLLTTGTGTDWTGEILSAIKRCDVFVALLVKSHNLLFEVGYALGAGKGVLLLRTSGVSIPPDVSSLPVFDINRGDGRSISEAVAWIRHAAIKSRRNPLRFDSSREMLHSIVNDESYLDEIEPRSFEECIAGVLREAGFDAVSTNDPVRGYDIEIHNFRDNTTAVVEVKKLNQNGRVAVSEVQRLVGEALTAGSSFAIIVTSGAFTSSAKYFAAESPIPVALLTIDQLTELDRDRFVDLVSRS